APDLPARAARRPADRAWRGYSHQPAHHAVGMRRYRFLIRRQENVGLFPRDEPYVAVGPLRTADESSPFDAPTGRLLLHTVHRHLSRSKRPALCRPHAQISAGANRPGDARPTHVARSPDRMGLARTDHESAAPAISGAG